MASPILRVEGVTKRFGGEPAVADLNLEVEEGAFVTLLGPSGCGKSTTLRILGGFETPDAGRVVLDGEDVTRRPPEKRGVNMVFQDYALFPHMSVARNVAFGLELKGWDRRSVARRVDELLELLSLGGFGDRRPDQLSGGQRQRVALARALAPDPKLLLLDEPLGALDAKLRVQVQDELKALQRRTGKTFVFVTHDQEEALTMSDRIVVMNAGRIEQDGSPEELYHRPASRFVADFLGQSNLLEGRIERSEGEEVALSWRGLSVRVATTGRRAEAGREGVAVLRPESVRVMGEALGLDNVFEARVLERVFKGDRVRLRVLVADAPGAEMTVSLPPAAAEALVEGPIPIGWSAKRSPLLSR